MSLIDIFSKPTCVEFMFGMNGLNLMSCGVKC